MNFEEVRGADGLTLNDRAAMVADAIGVSKARLANMILRNETYFGNCTGVKFKAKTARMMSVIFPSLDMNWFRSGEGSFNPDALEVPLELVSLVDSKASQFRILFDDPNGETAAVQYLISHGIDPDAFADKYGSIYPALFHYRRGTAQESAPSASDSGTSSTSDLLAIIADQQRTIARLTELLAQKNN